MTDWPISLVIQYLRIKSLGLTKTTPPEAKSTKRSLEEKIKELDSKQRKKLAKLIDSL